MNAAGCQDTSGPPLQRHETLVGIDSDGCVFDSLPVKLHNHVVPLVIRWWGLDPVAALVHRQADRINRFSAARGGNRFPNLILLFEALAAEPEVRRSRLALPDLDALRRFCESGAALGNAALAAAAVRDPDPELRRVLAWSRALSHDIDTRMDPVPPFAWARRSLERMAQSSDLVVISQTPEAAIRREWRQHGIDHLVGGIAGQEQGRKARQLARANGGRYPAGRMLMIGDAPGDQVAAAESGALFYPILPGGEEAAWRQFHDEAYPRFLSGTFAGAYAENCLARFQAVLQQA
jgi:phosphoglycolate phosphatase-like HAD superfamily hydrolase